MVLMMNPSKLLQHSSCLLKPQIHRVLQPWLMVHDAFWRSFHDENRLQQRPESPPEEIPQVSPSDGNQKVQLKGLETDFPCLSIVSSSGEESMYSKFQFGYKLCKFNKPFYLKLNNGVLPELEIAYETWGDLSEDKSNVILLCSSTSVSSHAKSHTDNPAPGWWEKFIGSGCAIDTDKFFVICTNILGGCYGTTGPSSINPLTNRPYGTTFPLVTVDDMVNAQFKLLDYLGIRQVHAAVGSSLGGMCSLTAAALYPERVKSVISMSACLYVHPTTIGFLFAQRRAIMMDPNWNKGHYYGKSPPKMGMKLARGLATIIYRSGLEWHEKFGRKIIKADKQPWFPHFMFERYIEKQSESFSSKFDPNTLLYVSKAVDFFDMGEGFPSLQESMKRITCPVMVLGVQTDMAIPCWQQREIADELKKSGNDKVTYCEVNSTLGHETFLLDVKSVGDAVKGSLETNPWEAETFDKATPKWR